MNATFRTEAHVTGIRRGSKGSHRTRTQSADTSVKVLQITAEELVRNKADGTQVAVLAGTSAANLLLDFRTAASADNREDKLIELLDQLYTRLYAGDIVEMTWPRDADAAAATVYLGAPLASVIHRCIEHTRGQLVIHTRMGTAGDFETLPFNSRVTFVMHLTSEEAAMRWERAEADPGRRLSAAARLRSAGWKVNVCLALGHLFTGWREDYADLVQRCISTEFSSQLISFVDENIFDRSQRQKANGREPIRHAITRLSSRQRREFSSFIERVAYQHQLETAA